MLGRQLQRGWWCTAFSEGIMELAHHRASVWWYLGVCLARPCSQWQWMDLSHLPESVVEFKRGVYTEVSDVCAPSAQLCLQAGYLR